ncbi:hypothetical protein L1049_013870 [Liquidambar formosana]|uniref:Uncharacterized protein n=1 Tax=Liquidambar formosana TaxID=63359 RepID=A0AAP0RMG6_LIQFO
MPYVEITEAKSVDCVGSGTASNTYNEVCNHQTEARGSAAGADSRTLERHDSYSDNLDRDSSDAIQPIIHSSEQAFSKHEPALNKEKREVNLDDVVGSTSSRVMSALGSTALGEVKARRSERERDLSRDILTSNSVSTAGRSSLGSFKGERKTKSKSKQKTNHSSTTGNGFPERLTESTHPLSPSVRGSSQSVANGSNKVSREVGLPSPVGIPKNSSKATEETIDLQACSYMNLIQ